LWLFYDGALVMPVEKQISPLRLRSGRNDNILDFVREILFKIVR
jgi:hypothetical protein